MKNDREKILQKLISLIESHFSDSIEFANLFGSWARFENEPDSDLDLMVVFKNRVIPLEKIEKFKEVFISFQLENNLIPDRSYPGEYVSIYDIKRAIGGYGFLKEEGFVEILPISSHQWTSFNEYRQWLSALGSPSLFLIGNKQKFKELKEISFFSITLLSMLATHENSFSLDEISRNLLKGDKEYLGFCHTQNTRDYLFSSLLHVVSLLISTQVVEPSNEEERFVLNRENALNKLPRIIEKSAFELNKKFLGFATTEEERQVFRKSVDIGMDFVLDDKRKVLNFEPETQIRGRFLEEIPNEGKGIDDILAEFKTSILDGSIRQSSPKYLAFPDSGNSVSSLAANILIGFTNQNLIATSKSAPTATFAEIQVIQWLRQLVGFEGSKDVPESALDVGGVITPGGTMANATALLVARCKSFPESRKKGLCNSSLKPILIIADDTLYHYSHIASFWWLGLGEENIVFVKALSDFRMDCDDLDKKLTQYNDGITSKVVAVVAQAGDSRTTTIEYFNKVAEVTKKHKVWLHVDACHGGILLFSQKHKHKMNGVEQADSISIDPHKGLCVPYSSSAVLFRDIKDSAFISKSTDITIQKGSFDLGQITPFLGSRAFDSLKLWFLIKHLGMEGIGKLVEYKYDIAKSWSKCISNSRFFECLNEVNLNSVVFSVSSDKIQKEYHRLLLNKKTIGEINKMIHDSIYKEGYLCIHTFDIIDVAQKIVEGKEKVRVLGVTLGNPNTLAADFPDHIEYLDEKAEEIIKNL